MEPEITYFDIISNLPPELQFLFFQSLVRAEKTFCSMVCRSWHQIIEKNWTGIRSSPGLILSHAAKNGYKGLLFFAKQIGATRFDCGMRWTAASGHLELMGILKDWSVIKPQHPRCPPHVIIRIAMSSSAKGGNLEGMELAKTWGALQYGRAMERAAAGGNLECMKLAKLWIETSPPAISSVHSRRQSGWQERFVKRTITMAVKDSLGSSSLYGQIKAMELAKEWGAENYDSAMEQACQKCQIEAMKLLRTWGASQFDKPIENLIKNITEQRHIIKRNDQKDSYRKRQAGSYVKFMIKGQIKPMLIKVPTVSQKASTRAYFQAELERMIECLELLKTWKKSLEEENTNQEPCQLVISEAERQAFNRSKNSE